MSGELRRQSWRPLAARSPMPAMSIAEAIEGLTDRVVAVRVLKEKVMSETEQPAAAQAAPATPLPPAPTIAPAVAPKPAPAGGFAASIRAMMDEARQGVERARADGLAEVQGAVAKLGEAKDATAKVARRMAQTIHDEAADVLAELGQISNDL